MGAEQTSSLKRRRALAVRQPDNQQDECHSAQTATRVDLPQDCAWNKV